MLNKGPNKFSLDNFNQLVENPAALTEESVSDKSRLEFALDLTKNPTPLTPQKNASANRKSSLKRAATWLGIDAQTMSKNRAKL